MGQLPAGKKMNKEAEGIGESKTECEGSVRARVKCKVFVKKRYR
jgi:hypothetical protein